MKTKIWVTDQFTRLHHWPDAPEDVAFLRHPHRHVFHVCVWIKVNHDNRDAEFFQVKRVLAEAMAELDDPYLQWPTEKSCEQFAQTILRHMQQSYPSCFKVEVSEDGENGAEVEDANQHSD